MELGYGLRVFLYEYATAGGLEDATDDRELRRELLAEGRAMRDALRLDLLAAGCAVTTLVDPRLMPPPGQGNEHVADGPARRAELFQRLAAESDGVILIAPESQSILEQLAQLVERVGGQLLSPDSTFIAIASDKHRTAERLRAAGVAAPRGWSLAAGEQPVLPHEGLWIRKPLDGAGSTEVSILSPNDVSTVAWPSRVEAFCEGLPASVAALCGAAQPVLLEPCEQLLKQDGSFQYLGGRLPLRSELSERAHRLAASALQAMPKTQGYVGIDMVLGSAPDGLADYVIEINPRLTTSYIGLRRAAHENLAAVMLQVARGESREVAFSTTTLRFSAEGHVTLEAEAEQQEQSWTG